MAACFTRSAVCCPAPSLRRHELGQRVEAAPVFGWQRRPACVSICCSLGFLKKKADPSTPSLGSKALAWATDVGPVVTIIGTVASFVVAWNTVVIQPNKVQLQELRTDWQKQLHELRTDQQQQIELLTTRLEQRLGPLKPLPERVARTEGQVDVVLKQQTALHLHDFGPRA
ncbi:hypothetical protein CHLRE_06g310300v5 [Chlamydomonas reinhardtii]|uniref:Uncharacterized protein n=1 Tax=Chlamydomonas reinhardtii TaxID=3055 RepID=A0A2K3DRM1_CHLRE|nr:uncharacterized protein CHLRE_06g310300v5 [Chlamydomonas reinhardtii]PNW83186.1 hypothetical protein CHLRE_06g310300v5 [Chlamydomonas reinhardtii]